MVARTALTISRCTVVSPSWAREKIIPRKRDAPDLYVTTGPVSREALADKFAGWRCSAGA